MPLRKMVYHSGKACDAKDAKPKVPVEEAFREDEIVCMVCGQGGMKTLARHLNFVHNLKPGQYRRMFGLRSRQKLTSRNYSEARKRFASESGSQESLTKARAARLAKLKGVLPQQSPSAGTAGDRNKRTYRRLHVFGS